ncbi:ATP-binding cassette domain-containing protein [Microbacterium sp.]|uniref:ABC transporter ATP-binding protein n=1 Tax=Microbacterium sp. TaxID=51671 RepID=UPI003F728ADF
MPEGQVLEFSGVTKRFGTVSAVSDFTARVEPGRVTGFLGPNGAGKTTSLRILLGLVRPTSGRATIGGVPYAKLAQPLQTVGAVLEASSFHPGRTAASHLRVYARAAKISDARVDEVLGLVGLSDAAGRKVGGFSLGMRQRLGLAYALLGDPGVLVLDEPSNGLDPEGIRWMRGFLRQLAGEGRTVLISSHLLTEVQQTVDALLIVSQGRLVFQGGLEELADPTEYATVVDAPDRASLASALAGADVPYEVLRSGVTVRNLTPAEVGVIAADAGVALSSLQRKGPALEEVFLELVSGARVHASAAGAMAPVAVPGVEQTDPDPVVEQADPDPVVDEAVAEPVVEEADPDPVVDDMPASASPEDAAAAAEELEVEATGGPVAAAAGAAAFATSTSGETVATGTIPVAAPAPIDLDAPHSFAVAATGVIDVVPAAHDVGDETVDDAAPAESHDDEPEAAASGEPTEPAEPSEPAEPAESSEPVASTAPDAAPEDEPLPEGFAADGVLPEATPVAPVDADPDVEAIGAIDEELETASAEGHAAEERPFDTYDKTTSDVDADAFFSSFDASQGGGPEDAREPADPPGAEDAAARESAEETEEFGSLVDLDPEWAESADHRDENEGGEQR